MFLLIESHPKTANKTFSIVHNYTFVKIVNNNITIIEKLTQTHQNIKSNKTCGII